jgi:hypothetical protein
VSNSVRIYVLSDLSVAVTSGFARELEMLANRVLLLTATKDSIVIDVLKDRYGYTAGKEYHIGAQHAT